LKKAFDFVPPIAAARAITTFKGKGRDSVRGISLGSRSSFWARWGSTTAFGTL
jgi:hypothetical protein